MKTSAKRARMAQVFGLFGVAWIAGCGAEATTRQPADGDVPAQVAVLDHPTTVPFRSMGGVPVVDVRVNDRDAVPMIVDTGSPVTFINPYAVAVDDPSRAPPTLYLGESSLRGVPVLLGDPFGLGTRVGGVLGASALMGGAQTFDFRASTLTLGAATRASDTEDDETVIPFTLEGGGVVIVPPDQRVSIPASRLVVEARIEGRPVRLVVDTGAGAVSLRQSVFDAIVTDARVRSSVRVTSQGGTQSEMVTRVRTITVAGATVPDVVVTAFNDTVLDRVAAKTGSDLDGLLGVTFLREFAVTLDYPTSRLRLRRFTSRSHIRDEYRRVGALVALDPAGRPRVTRLLPSAAGLRVGDLVDAIDDHPLVDLTDDAIDWLLRGAVGETRTLRVAGRDVTLPVEDFLPLP